MGLGGLIGLMPGLIALMIAAAGWLSWSLVGEFLLSPLSILLREEKGNLAGVLSFKAGCGTGRTGAIINFLMISVLKTMR